MDRPTLSERLRYWFDGWMSRGAIALIGLLGLATVALVVVVGTLAWIFHAFPDDATDGDLFDLWWGGLMRTLDPGTMGLEQHFTDAELKGIADMFGVQVDYLLHAEHDKQGTEHSVLIKRRNTYPAPTFDGDTPFASPRIKVAARA